MRATLVAQKTLRRAKARFYEDASMKIGVLFFGVLKEVVGRSSETRRTAGRSAGAGTTLSIMRARLRGLTRWQPSLAISVNHEYAGVDRVLREGDEVGLLPPVSGGSADAKDLRAKDLRAEVRNGEGEVRMVRERIDAEAVIARLKRPADGATVIFDGVVRDNTRGRRTLYLEYEAYEAMALKQMESLAQKARALLRCAEHRSSTGWGGSILGRRAC